jgi:hypothetical protein
VYFNGGLNIDIIGPVDRDLADKCYILVVIDCFTRFVDLYPVSDIYLCTTMCTCTTKSLLSHYY